MRYSILVVIWFFGVGFGLFNNMVFACELTQIDRFVVLRHATGTHILDDKLNSLNSDEDAMAQGSSITEAHLTLVGIRGELKKTADQLTALGITAGNSCIVSSENARAVQTAAVIHDYLIGEFATYSDWRGIGTSDSRLSSPELESLKLRISKKSEILLTDSRLREAFFGPAFEDKPYSEIRRASDKIVLNIEETSENIFTVAFEVGQKKKSAANYESEAISVGAPVESLILDFNPVKDLSGTLDPKLILRNQFLAGKLRAAKVKVGEGRRVTLASAQGAETKEEIFARTVDFLKNPNGLKAKISKCCSELGADQKITVIFSTHDSAGAQFISYLLNGYDAYPGQNYRLAPAEAVVVPMNSEIGRRLGWAD